MQQERFGRTLAVLVIAGIAQLAGGSAVWAVDTDIPPVNITDVVTVQPIDVCDVYATNCASLSNLPAYEQAANAIWNQAGIGFVFLPPVQFSDPAYLNPTITIAPGFPSGTPTDLVHQLMYGPGHGQSSNPTTLNVWFVDTLTRTDNDGVYGTGFIGGNGITLPTLPNPATGGLPVLDTLAHELGHNLGLQHVDSSASADPLDLLQSVGRTFPTDTCQINGNTCTPSSQGTDQLSPGQIAKAQNPLFTIDLAHATANLDAVSGECEAGASFCNIKFDFLSSATTQSLLAVKVRFLDFNAIASGTIISASSPQGVTGNGPTVSPLSPSGGYIEYDFAPGSFVAGDEFDIGLDYSHCSNYPYYYASCSYSSPFSVEFDFSSGITSGALFDGSDSQLPDLTLPSSFAEGLGFIGTPTYGVGKIVPVVACTDVEGNQNTGAVSPCSFAAVPEPPDLAVLPTALMMLAITNRFRRKSKPFAVR
jgi:hypothetical protein